MDMAAQGYLTTAALNEIVRYERDRNRDERGVRYTGAIRKHPYDRSKFLLVTSPGEDETHFYEFKVADIVRAENARQVVTEDGESIQLIHVEVQIGSIGIEMRPFEVGEDRSEKVTSN